MIFTSTKLENVLKSPSSQKSPMVAQEPYQGSDQWWRLVFHWTHRHLSIRTGTDCWTTATPQGPWTIMDLQPSYGYDFVFCFNQDGEPSDKIDGNKINQHESRQWPKEASATWIDSAGQSGIAANVSQPLSEITRILRRGKVQWDILLAEQIKEMLKAGEPWEISLLPIPWNGI